MREYVWLFGIPILIVLLIGVADFLFTSRAAQAQAKKNPR